MHAMSEASPDIVIHMAAQPLVRYSYTHPIETFTTNVVGTANVLESVRLLGNVRAVLVVTTDKCYENDESGNQFDETHPLGGHDPYSCSKACAELVTSAFRQSYFSGRNSNFVTAIATARAGNVIGGGDWATDRLVPDAIRAFQKSSTLNVRNPLAIRPWQHVLEPLSGYLLLTQQLFKYGDQFAQAWNFGPRDMDARSVSAVLDLLAHGWPDKVRW
jgi:CDP-glucose 4,6-dehydratase